MRAVLLVAVVTIAALPAVAEEPDAGFAFVGEEVDTSFEASRSRLKAQGYSGIEMENGSAYHLKALDPEGSEVLLTVDPQTGEHSRVTSP